MRKDSSMGGWYETPREGVALPERRTHGGRVLRDPKREGDGRRERGQHTRGVHMKGHRGSHASERKPCTWEDTGETMHMRGHRGSHAYMGTHLHDFYR